MTKKQQVCPVCSETVSSSSINKDTGSCEECSIFTKHKPASPGKPKSFARPLSDKQRRAEAAAKSKAIGDTLSDSERYSIEGAEKMGLSQPKGHRAEDLEAQMVQGRLSTPPPLIVDLSGSNAVLAQVKDEELRERIKDFLSILLEGGKHKTAMAQTNFNWNHIQNLRHKYNGLHELWVTCRDVGDEYRQVIRTDAAHERAVEGVDDPIYSPAGKYLGSKKIYSDKLLELLIKADNPERFNPTQNVKVEGTVLNINIGFDRETLRDEYAASEVEEEE